MMSDGDRAQFVHELTIRPKYAPAYRIVVERGWNEELSRFIEELDAQRIFLISQKGLEDFVLCDLLRSLSRFFPAGLESEELILLEPGEVNKHLARLGPVYNELIEKGADRRSLLLAVGGGVVGDFVGFIAATLFRGIDFIQLPTTLLAAVDASVGGKTAVNVDRGKNMVGAFHQPRLVYFNTELLKTLPPAEWLCGLAEMAKHAFIAESPPVFEELSSKSNHIRNPQSEEFRRMVVDSIGVKVKVVEQDERETGLRAILNLGHTTAHAIESVTRYTRFSHGEAVSRGLVTALLLSRRKTGLSLQEEKEMLELMSALSLPLDTAGLDGRELLADLRYDKKTVGGIPRFVLLAGRGRARPGQIISSQEFLDAWSEQRERFG